MSKDIFQKPVPIVLKGKEVRDGAGVKITRLFGSQEVFQLTDPFLLLDFFGSNNPDEYTMGFPWHPHRGIETLTYLISGSVEHEDSNGNVGKLMPGEIQWMTAGSGIFHNEMPKPLGKNLEMMGFQLWINLPKSMKMSKPTYRHINVNDLGKFQEEGNEVKIISGKFNENEGSYLEHSLKIMYLDIRSNGKKLTLFKSEGFTSLIIPMKGEINANGIRLEPGDTGVFNSSFGSIEISGNEENRFIYISGQRTNDQIAWYGPVVMNTWYEIEKAFRELRNGTFIRDSSPDFKSY